MSVLVASYFGRQEKYVGASAVLIVKAYNLLHFMMAVIIIRVGKSKQRPTLFVQLAISGFELHHTIDVGCRSSFAGIMPDGCHETVVRDYCMVSLDRVRLVCTFIETCVL